MLTTLAVLVGVSPPPAASAPQEPPDEGGSDKRLKGIYWTSVHHVLVFEAEFLVSNTSDE